MNLRDLAKRSRRLPLALALLGLALPGAQAQVPAALAADPGLQPVLRLQARGVQVYACEVDAKDPQRAAWVLRGPQAQLFDEQGRVAGRHGYGPSWELLDGSRVLAAVVAKDPGPNPQAIAWLLLRVKEHSGKGALDAVQQVRRVSTVGGKAPPACAPAQAGQELRVDYQARYEFFAPAR